MRLLFVTFFAVASLAHAHAEEMIKKTDSSCSYTIRSGDSYAVPAGETLCWRVPPPFTKEYTLLRCDPPFQEMIRVRRGDPRCNRYEERQ